MHTAFNLLLVDVSVSMVTSNQAQELSEAAVKIGLLEKKVDSAGGEVCMMFVCFKSQVIVSG